MMYSFNTSGLLIHMYMDSVNHICLKNSTHSSNVLLRTQTRIHTQSAEDYPAVYIFRNTVIDPFPKYLWSCHWILRIKRRGPWHRKLSASWAIENTAGANTGVCALEVYSTSMWHFSVNIWLKYNTYDMVTKIYNWMKTVHSESERSMTGGQGPPGDQGV